VSQRRGSGADSLLQQRLCPGKGEGTPRDAFWSGIVSVGKPRPHDFREDPAAKQTSGWLGQSREKRYEQFVEGPALPERGTFESDLDETNPFKVHSRARCPRRGTPSTSTIHGSWRAVEGTLVELALVTGTPSSVRVQLAEQDARSSATKNRARNEIS